MRGCGNTVTLKCYMADTGLQISHALGSNPKAIEEIVRHVMFDSISINEGMLIENAVAHMLVSQGVAVERLDKRHHIGFLIFLRFPKICVRFCLCLTVCSGGTICPVPRETDGKVRELVAKRCKSTRTNAPECGIISADNSRIVAFDASVGTSETWKVHVCAKRSGGCTRTGCMSLSWVHTGLFQGLRRNTGEECAIFLFP